MPRDFIDNATYSEHRARLQHDLDIANSAYDAAALAAATDEAAKPALAVSRGAVDDAKAALAGLERARELSEQEAQRQREAQAATDKRQRAREIIRLKEDAHEAAQKAQAALQSFLAAARAAGERYRQFDSALRAEISGHNRERIVTDTLNHRFDASIIIGALQKANVAGIDQVDDPIDAMRSTAGMTLDGTMLARANRAINLAATDLPDLRQADAVEAEEQE